jgi:ankyrin repeat protein
MSQYLDFAATTPQAMVRSGTSPECDKKPMHPVNYQTICLLLLQMCSSKEITSKRWKNLLPMEKEILFDVNYVSGVVCERNSILNLAVIHGRQKVARWLVESKGADIESSDRGGFTPLLNAAWAGNIKLVRFLMSKGADRMKLGRGHYSKPLAAPDFKGHTAEGWAREKEYPDVAELLRVGL